MAIEIRTRKEVNSAGEKGYRVLSVEALKRSQLPKMYLNNIPRVYRNGEDLILWSEKDKNWPIWVRKDAFYTEAEMAERNAIIMEAGQRLHDINKHLARERAKWRGTVTFVDGKEKPSSAKEEEIPSIKALRKEGRLYYRNKRGQIVPLKEEV